MDFISGRNTSRLGFAKLISFSRALAADCSSSGVTRVCSKGGYRLSREAISLFGLPRLGGQESVMYNKQRIQFQLTKNTSKSHIAIIPTLLHTIIVRFHLPFPQDITHSITELFLP